MKKRPPARHRRQRGRHKRVAGMAGTAVLTTVVLVAPPEEPVVAQSEDTLDTDEFWALDPAFKELRVEQIRRAHVREALEEQPERPIPPLTVEEEPDPEPTSAPEKAEPPVVEEVDPEPPAKPATGLSELRSEVLAFGRAQIGDPYVYGAEGPNSWDCSGLTQAAFASVGISIPRVSSDQHNIGDIVPISELNPGDLVGWPGHVALYAGDWTIVEAAKPGTLVRERAITDNWFDDGAFGIKLDYETL